jgi:hypothetical protein
MDIGQIIGELSGLSGCRPTNRVSPLAKATSHKI